MASTRSRRHARNLAILCALVVLVAMVVGYVARGVGESDASPSDEVGLAVEGEGRGGGEGDPAAETAEGSLPDAAPAGARGADGPSGRSVLLVDGDIVEAASDVLQQYREQRDVLLARSGWVDLVGNVWGCVVQGPGWVEVCLVSGDEASGGSRVETIRMEVSEWRDAYGEKLEGLGEAGPDA